MGHSLFDIEIVPETGPVTWRRRILVAAPDHCAAVQAALIVCAREGRGPARMRSIRVRDYYIVERCSAADGPEDVGGVLMLDIDGRHVMPQFTPRRRR